MINLIGGIGIMNIMLVSVTERNLRSVTGWPSGPWKARCSLQFLIEAVVVLSAFGGLVGIKAALGTCVGHALMHMPFLFNPGINLLAFSFLGGDRWCSATCRPADERRDLIDNAVTMSDLDKSLHQRGVAMSLLFSARKTGHSSRPVFRISTATPQHKKNSANTIKTSKNSKNNKLNKMCRNSFRSPIA